MHQRYYFTTVKFSKIHNFLCNFCYNQFLDLHFSRFLLTVFHPSLVWAVARSGQLLLLTCWRRSPSPFWPGGREVGAEPGIIGVDWINVCMLCKIRWQRLGFLRFAYSLQLTGWLSGLTVEAGATCTDQSDIVWRWIFHGSTWQHTELGDRSTTPPGLLVTPPEVVLA